MTSGAHSLLIAYQLCTSGRNICNATYRPHAALVEVKTTRPTACDQDETTCPGATRRLACGTNRFAFNPTVRESCKAGVLIGTRCHTFTAVMRRNRFFGQPKTYQWNWLHHGTAPDFRLCSTRAGAHLDVNVRIVHILRVHAKRDIPLRQLDLVVPRMFRVWHKINGFPLPSGCGARKIKRVKREAYGRANTVSCCILPPPRRLNRFTEFPPITRATASFRIDPCSVLLCCGFEALS